MKSDFFADSKKQHALRPIAKLDYKTSKEYYVYFQKKNNQIFENATAAQNQKIISSHYIIPNIKVRFKHINKSMTFKKYSKPYNALQYSAKKSIVTS